MTKIILDKGHPAFQILQNEGFEVVDRAEAQTRDDIAAPLRVGIINLMPTPVDPVADFGRLLAQNPNRNIEIFDFSPTPEKISDNSYTIVERAKLIPLNDIGDYSLDGAFLSGFGKEDMAFEQLRFWNELTDALDILEQDNTPIYASCWGAHAALYHHHDVEKTWDVKTKVLGVFDQQISEPDHPLVRGIDPELGFPMPVSRIGKCNEGQILANPNLTVIATNEATGASIVADGRITYITGHPEYNAQSLPQEYVRDVARNAPHLCVPVNVFANDRASCEILPARWLEPAETLINNWVDTLDTRNPELKPTPNFGAPFPKPMPTA